MTSETGVVNIEPQDLYQNLSSYELIDVRGPDEYVGPLSHIVGSRLETLGPPLEKFLSLSLSQLKEKKLAFICRSGGRSMRAAEFANTLGYKKVFNLSGGMIAWNEMKLPVAK